MISLIVGTRTLRFSPLKEQIVNIGPLETPANIANTINMKERG